MKLKHLTDEEQLDRLASIVDESLETIYIKHKGKKIPMDKFLLN